MVDINTGIAQTLASREDGIGTPTGIACHRNFIIFADSEQHCLWHYVFKTRKLTLFAGIPHVKGFNGDGLPSLNTTFNTPLGIHYDDADKQLLIADSMNHRIRSISMDTTQPQRYGVVLTVAGTGESGYNGDSIRATEAQLNAPSDVYQISSNSYFIADSDNNRVRAVIENEMTTYAGTGEYGSGGDGGYRKNMQLYKPKSVFSSGNTLFIGDTNNNRIRVIGLTYGMVDTSIGGGVNEEGLGSRSKLSYPSSVRQLGNYLAIADTYSNLVKLYDIKSGMMKTVVGGIGDGGDASTALIKPYAVAISPKTNEIYVTDVENNKIRKISRDNSMSTVAGKGYGFNGDSSDATLALLAHPTGIAVNLNDEIFFSDSNNHRIRIIHSNGSITTLAGTGMPGFKDGISTQAELNYPTCLKLIPPNFVDIIFTDSFNQKIRKISRLQDGKYYVYTIAGNSNTTTTQNNQNEILALEDNLQSPEGLTFSPISGNIYLSDSSQNVIRELTPFCQEGYILNQDFTVCLPLCFGIPSNESTLVCNNGNGKCIDTNQCACSSQFSGEKCQIPICFNFPNTSSQVCSFGNGTCLAPDSCNCNSGYTGLDCGVAICFGVYGEDACSGHGNCIRNDVCSCHSSYVGRNCDVNMMALGIGLGLAVALLVITITCIAVAITWCSLRRKHKKLTDTDLVLDERLLVDYDSSTITSSTTKSDDSDKFIIPIEQLNMDKPIKRLGEGGIGSVYSTKFNGMIIAVKVFDLNNLSISENDFKVEAILLSKLRHPNIINFYGVSSTPTKRFIAMECMDRSLESVIANLQRTSSYNTTTTTKSTTNSTLFKLLNEKLGILRNVVSGIYYLHHLEPNYIVHRDLKPANILLDRNGVAKLCDFGLGRALSSNTLSAITTHIGTSSYMAPELYSGEGIDREDARSIDIYSLAIIMWQLIFEVMEPYQSTDKKVLEKLKLSKPNSYSSAYHFHRSVCEDGLRPIIPFSNLRECKEWCEEFTQPEHFEVIFEMSELIKQAWSKEPSRRPSIDVILERIEQWEDLTMMQ